MSDTQNELNEEEGLPDSGDELTQKCEDLERGWKRALADYENLKRDMDSRLAQSRNRIKADFAESLLPVMDNFQEALRHTPAVEDPAIINWLTGVSFIKKQFEDIFASLGLEPLKTVGEPFNAHFHEAVKEESVPEKADQEILQEITTGWKMGELVIRPAKVVVNKKEQTS